MAEPTPRVSVMRPGFATFVVCALLAGAGPIGLVGDPAGAVALAPSEAPSAAAELSRRRVVWDEYRKDRPGIHLRTARGDGSGRHRVYDSDHGFTLDLALDRDATRVAFVPCCRKDLPILVVAPVDGGRPREPLAKHPEIYYVGGIGWSPDGKRLAFEGIVLDGHGGSSTWLMTVRPSGNDLRRLVLLPREDPDEPFTNQALAWTGGGILYSDGSDLRVARAGSTRVVMRRVVFVHPSGDGRHLLVTRPATDGRYRGELWLAAPDGSDRHRIYRFPKEPGEGLYQVMPDHHARHFLALRLPTATEPPGQTVVTWSRDEDPETATPVDFLRRAAVFTWD